VAPSDLSLSLKRAFKDWRTAELLCAAAQTRILQTLSRNINVWDSNVWNIYETCLGHVWGVWNKNVWHMSARDVSDTEMYEMHLRQRCRRHTGCSSQVHFSAEDIWCLVLRTQVLRCLKSRCLTSEVWCLVSTVWSRVSEIWFLKSGVWSLVSGAGLNEGLVQVEGCPRHLNKTKVQAKYRFLGPERNQGTNLRCFPGVWTNMRYKSEIVYRRLNEIKV
jgi:hypothetical protein